VPEPSAGDHGDDDLVRVLPSGDCPVGTPQEPELRLVSVGTTEVIVVRLADGEVVAFTSRCPHQGTDLTDRSPRALSSSWRRDGTWWDQS